MPLLYPIGNLQTGVDKGVIDTNYQYDMFEPNESCDSKVVHTNISSNFQNQTMFLRKVALPYLIITYNYSDIFASERSQIEHFISSSNSADGGSEAFYVVDFKNGDLPSAITSAFKFTITNTTKYSAVTNQKANRAFFWNGSVWKLGVVTVTSATQVTVNVTTPNYGSMTTTQVQAKDVWVYPVYTCYLNGAVDLKTTKFFNSNDSDRGWMSSGTVSFISKYKV